DIAVRLAASIDPVGRSEESRKIDKRWRRLEAILLGHPAVADAAVIPSPDEEAGEVPKAFVLVTTPTPAEAIMAFVAARVAPHKRIRKLQFIDAIPKSASGKILRRTLIEEERTKAEAGEASAAASAPA